MVTIRGARHYQQLMDLDDLLQRYFATSDITELPPAALSAGIEKCQVDLGLEQDRGKRFALWALLHMLGGAPEWDVIFDREEDREAARTFIEMLEASEAEGRR